MKSMRWIIPSLLALLLLAACTPYYYGVREDIWLTMSEPERLAAIDAYKERQLAIQRANEARAQQRKLELERLRLFRAEEESRHHARIQAIYQTSHAYGDLIRVRLQGGTMYINGRSRAYRPAVFTIANGEIRNITIYSNRGDAVDLQVAYIDGRLYFDGEPTTHSNRTARLTLGLDWGLGHIYAGVSTRNTVRLSNVEIYVEIIDTRRHDLRRSQLPAIVIHRDAGREQFDQRRIDNIRPQRLNWPDPRQQQLNRQERKLDRREEQLNQMQQQIEQREREMKQQQHQVNRQQKQVDRRQQQVEKQQDALERQQRQVEKQKRQVDRQQQRVDYRQQQTDRQPQAPHQQQPTFKNRQQQVPPAIAPQPVKKERATAKQQKTLTRKQKAQAEKAQTKKDKADKDASDTDTKDHDEEEDKQNNGKGEKKSDPGHGSLNRSGR